MQRVDDVTRVYVVIKGQRVLEEGFGWVLQGVLALRHRECAEVLLPCAVHSHVSLHVEPGEVRPGKGAVGQEELHSARHAGTRAAGGYGCPTGRARSVHSAHS